MKKLLLLFLAIAGMVRTASADSKTIYVENTIKWPQLYLYMFKTGGGHNAEWPGELQNTKVSIDGKDVYTITLDETNYDTFILVKENGRDQTKNLSISDEAIPGTYYYIQVGDNDNYKNCTIHSMTLYENVSYTVNVKSANNWTHCIYMYNEEVYPCGAWNNSASMTDNGNDVYSYSFTLDKTFKTSFQMIINNNHQNESNQTGDITVYPGTSNFILNGTTLSYAEVLTLNASGYATYVNTNPLTITTSTAYYATDNGDGNATAHAITNPAASTPMLIKGEANTTYYFEVAGSGTDVSSSNAFKQGEGTALAGGSSPYNYILKGDQFYLANGNTVAKNKAYLQLSVAATARPLIFEDEDVSGITTVNAVNNNTYYNMQGVKVAQPVRGLYIMNGKKYLVK